MTPFPDLEKLIRPRNILVVGGSRRPHTPGAQLLENLTRHSELRGEVVVVNPSMHGSAHGYSSYESISAVPPIGFDVALVMVNASMAVQALRDCAKRSIPFAIVMSSGFSEVGSEGAHLEEEIAALCRSTGLRVYGPNCPGLTNLRDRIGMTFSPNFRTDNAVGPVGLVTQGGGMGRAILQGLSPGCGASLWFSAGNEVDLGPADFIAHMATDPSIKVISVLLEGAKNGERFASALDLARSNGKQVVILKVGQSEYGVRAAQSHTGSLAGHARVNSAIYRQFGAIEVRDVDELVSVTRLAVLGVNAKTEGIAIFTMSGGAAALAADVAGVHGVPMATLAPDTVTELRGSLPPFAAVENPVDVTAEALSKPALLTRSLETVAADPRVGLVLVPIPADYGVVTQTLAKAIIDVGQASRKPIVPVWMSRFQGSGYVELESSGFAPFTSLTKALTAISRCLWAAPGATLSGAPGNPGEPATEPSASRSVSGSVAVLSEVASKGLLREAGISIPRGVLARTRGEAVSAAERLGYPVAMKISSAQIPHKTEVNGVRLGIASSTSAETTFDELVAQVASARPDATLDGVLVEKMLSPEGREILVGVHTDPSFGRILTVGLGGIFVELINDVSHRLLPIGLPQAFEMISELKYHSYLGAFRGRAPADIRGLAELLVRISDFVAAHPEIREADFNPVWVGLSGEGAVPLDALLVTDKAQ